MSESTKITTLAPSGAGKTCFLASMFHMFESGVAGFNLATPDLKDANTLNEIFLTLCDPQAETRWPLGTSGNKLFSFDLNLGLDKIYSFDWLDYPGGHLAKSTSEPEVKSLLAQLAASSAILICLDGEQLQQGGDPIKGRVDLGVNRIVQWLTLIRETIRREGRVLPLVCLVVTKGDALLQAQRPANGGYLARIKGLYNVLFEPSASWPVAVVAVSLGKGLVRDKEKAAISPVAVHAPLLFVMHQLLADSIRQDRQNHSSLRAGLEVMIKERRVYAKGLTYRPAEKGSEYYYSYSETPKSPFADERTHREKKLLELETEIKHQEGILAMIKANLPGEIYVFKGGMKCDF
jgi:hypothetical protein